MSDDAHRPKPDQRPADQATPAPADPAYADLPPALTQAQEDAVRGGLASARPLGGKTDQ